MLSCMTLCVILSNILECLLVFSSLFNRLFDCLNRLCSPPPPLYFLFTTDLVHALCNISIDFTTGGLLTAFFSNIKSITVTVYFSDTSSY